MSEPTGREAIMKKVRAALASPQGAAGDAARASGVAERLAGRPRHPTPSRVAGKSAEALVDTFATYLRGAAATVVEVETADVPSTIATYLRQSNLPSALRMGGDPYLAALAWDREPTLTRFAGRADANDEVGLSLAIAGVAETGTLILASGPDNPVTLNFLPETHVVVVRRSTVVAAYEDAWAQLRQRFPDGEMPRTVNMISGPSRTGDIGGRIVLGAHGPRRLCVIIARD